MQNWKRFFHYYEKLSVYVTGHRETELEELWVLDTSFQKLSYLKEQFLLSVT